MKFRFTLIDRKRFGTKRKKRASRVKIIFFRCIDLFETWKLIVNFVIFSKFENTNNFKARFIVMQFLFSTIDFLNTVQESLRGMDFIGFYKSEL